MAFDPSQNMNNREGELSEVDSFIQLKNITKYRNGDAILKNISFSIRRGEFFSILGPSGGGKTTLLRILDGLEKPTDGRIIIDGEDVTDWPPYKRPVNMMFQSYALFPHMTVPQNIEFGLKQEGLKKDEINKRIEEVMELTKLNRIKDIKVRKINELSGGQRQSVALARSLAKRPKVLLLDEPLSALDKDARQETQYELINIQEQTGITFVFVTHDQEEAMAISDRIAVINKEQQICQIGTPHNIYEFPNTEFTATFIGEVNLFDCTVLEQDTNYLLLQSHEIDNPCYASYNGVVSIGANVKLAIRPEKIMISTLQPAYPRNCTQGIIEEILYLGDISVYRILLSSGKRIKVTLTNLRRVKDRDLDYENKVYLFWSSENSLVLTS
ncbi:MAG: ABC transporter ATP-binding protein [Holosporales bacterium]|jgi:putrescine transport system ATP-binding protein|nr:ABC transporter ATP-binding protein [Holosporales bacterium]